MITLTVVDEGNQNRTSIQFRFGVGTQRANGQENQVQWDQRTVTRWLFAKDLAGRRSAVTRMVLSLSEMEQKISQILTSHFE